MTQYTTITYEDHTALYADGKLIKWADSYLIDDYLFYEVLGGTQEPSDALYVAFSADDSDYQPPATLEEYRQWPNEKDAE